MLLASVLRDGGLLTYKEDKIEHEAGKQPDGSGRLYSGDFTPVGAGGKAVSYPSLYSSRTIGTYQVNVFLIHTGQAV